MMAELRSEIRKLLSVRSTYYLLAVTTALIVLIGLYIEGYRLEPASLKNPLLLNNTATDAINSLILFGGVVGLLLMTHEYRYNTIIYTLTASRSRTKVLVAKILTMTLFAIVFCALVGFLSPAMTWLGVHLAHHGNLLVPQTVHYGDVAWRLFYYGWAYIMTALMLAVLIRNQVTAIVSLFLIPTIEQILSLLLKNNSVYLPLTSLGSIVSAPQRGTITHIHAVMVFSAYLVTGWLVAWVLFLRRDAQ